MRRVRRMFRSALALCVDSLVVLLVHRDQAAGIGLVRLDAIGDYVLWRDAAASLIAHCRERGEVVTLIANQLWADLAQSDLTVDGLIAIDRARFITDLRYRFRIGVQVRTAMLKTVVSLTQSRDFMVLDCIVRLTGADQRIGVSGDNDNSSGIKRRTGDRWYTRLLVSDPTPSMELSRNSELVQLLGVIPRPHRPLRGGGSPGLFDKLSGRLSYFVLVPGASWTGKRWPVERFAEVGRRLAEHTGWTGVICGGPDEVTIAQDVADRGCPGWLNLAGKTRLNELVDVIAGAEVVITNDTSSVHIAAAAGTPSVCITGGGHFGRFLPYDSTFIDRRSLPVVVNHRLPCYNCNWQCPFLPHDASAVPCVDLVTVDAVWEATASLLHIA